MKRLAIFCDGTWNKPSNTEATHVERLSLAIPETSGDGVAQRARYFPGVGSGEGATWLDRTVDQLGGGAFGWGLDAKILRAFTWLAENYAPGDAIYIFGFSRGAYTARSLGGMIRASGLPSAENHHRIAEAFSRYRDRDPITNPRTDESAAFRWGFSPHVTTGKDERRWRRDHGHPEGTKLQITYMGIWDTVGALGLPGIRGKITERLNAKYLFHDTELSSAVLAGRHALATDEQRRFYEPTAWSNLPKLNEQRADRPYRQEWFAGDHGMVGGSGADKQLGEYSMDWIIDGAISAGLEVDAAFRADVRARRRFGGGLSNHRPRMFRQARRVTPHTPDVATATLHRLAFGDANGARYDPETLQPLRAGLAERLPTDRDPDWP